MGWWSVDSKGESLLLGDAGLDLIKEAFEQISVEYNEAASRKPSLNELLFTIEVVLRAELERFVARGEFLELTSISAKVKKRSKSQSYRLGDIFTIPLQNGRYVLGRILSDVLKTKMGMLVGIYDQTVEHPMVTPELRGKPFMFTPFYCSDEGWVTGRWKIIKNLPIAKDEFLYPKFKQGTESSGWWIVDQDQMYEATAEQIKDLEYARLWTMSSVERRIEQYASIPSKREE